MDSILTNASKGAVLSLIDMPEVMAMLRKTSGHCNEPIPIGAGNIHIEQQIPGWNLGEWKTIASFAASFRDGENNIPGIIYMCTERRRGVFTQHHV